MGAVLLFLLSICCERMIFLASKMKSLRGMLDSLPDQTAKYRYIEQVALETASDFGYGELRTPTMEQTELFARSVGETTDVVQKEMYTFTMGKHSITLRPEGTAGAVRAALENGLLSGSLPAKLSYITTCFRHENPQAGRLREFHQFGVECFGASSALADAEVISLGAQVLSRLGLEDVSLFINSIGCPNCRPAYNQLLKDYYRSHFDSLCTTCQGRLEKNPLRLLDCKEKGCQVFKKDAPRILDHLCEECQDHFTELKLSLDAMGIAYKIDPDIVRGLDYYTRTVFEFVSDKLGAQSTVCGGGRYDGLIELMGGPHTPAIGFGLGLERLLMIMEASSSEFPKENSCDIYIGSMGEDENRLALALVSDLRQQGFTAICDIMNRGIKPQMKYANKISARYSCMIGSNELEQKFVSVKDMNGEGNWDVSLNPESMRDFLFARETESILQSGNGLGDHFESFLENLKGE